MNCFKNCCSDNTNTDNEKTTELIRTDIREDDNNNINNLIKNENDNKININLGKLKQEEKTIKTMQENLNAVKKEYDEQIAKLEQKKTDLDCTQNQLAIIQDEIKSATAKYNNQLAELEQQKSDAELEQQKSDLDKQILVKKSQIQEYSQIINNNNNELSQLQEQIELKTEVYENSRWGVQGRNIHIKKEKEKNNKIQYNIKSKNTLHEINMNKYNKAETEKEASLRSLKQEWDKKNNEIQEFEKKIVEIKANMKKLTNAENELKNNIKVLDKKELQVKQETNNIENTTKANKEEYKKIKSSLSMLQEQNDKLKKSIIERQKNIEQLEQECKNHEKKKQQLVRTNNYLKCKQYEGDMEICKLTDKPFYEQQHGKEKKKIIFLDKNGQQLTDIETINKNINEQNFNPVALYKKDNKDVYTQFKTESDINNNSEIYLAHQLFPKSK